MLQRIIYTALIGITFYACSTEKNAALNRGYHYTTTRFNGYFHGKEAYKLALKTINENHVDDYDNILDVYREGDQTTNKEQFSNLNRAINKSAKMIDRHGMKFKKKGKTIEVNKMIDDCYLLIAKSRYLKYDLESSVETYKFIQSSFDKEDIRFDAALGLIKAYILQENFVDAETQISALKEDKEFPDKLQDELATIEAISLIKSKDYPEAIKALEKAVLLTKKKKFKHRLNFIRAQLHQELGNTKEAADLYTVISKKAINYDLQFNAKINLAKTFDGSGEELIAIFEKMLKDEKNKEYNDQIYFALAQVYAKQGNTDLSIENYKLAAVKSVNNPKQKGKAYLALGDFYFDKPNFPLASSYYDSCLTSLPKSFPDYPQIDAKNKSLSELVKHLNTIQKEDSLQRISNLSEEEKLIFAETQINTAREQQELKEAQLDAKRERDLAAAATQGSNGETWIFDNPTMLSAGAADFAGIWGDIKLGDNWRRSDKTSISFADVEASNETNANTDIPENQTVDFYLKDVPTSPEAIELSNNKLKKAYYALAILYRDQFENLKQSNHYFELLNSRFPKNKKEAEALYQLYRNYDKLNSASSKEKNKQALIKDYPNSEYAQLLLNPNKIADQEKKEQKANQQYEAVYQTYQSGDYAKTIQDIQSIKPESMSPSLAPRFSLLEDFAKGNLYGKDSLVFNLRKTQSQFMGTQVANEIDLILGKINREEKKLKKAETDSLNKAKAFILTKSEPHYFVLVYSNETVKSEDIAAGISNFNNSYFKNLNLQVKTIAWSDKENAIIVKPLNSEKDYYQYYTTVQSNFLKDQKNIGDLYFNISKTNYAKLFKFKDIVGYADYFKKNYFASEK